MTGTVGGGGVGMFGRWIVVQSEGFFGGDGNSGNAFPRHVRMHSLLDERNSEKEVLKTREGIGTW